MTYEELCRVYDGAIPNAELILADYGSMDHYAISLARRAHRQFYYRCRDIVQSLAAWRKITRYSHETKETMLERLWPLLKETRHQAVSAFSLSSKPSNNDVIAAPINTA